MPSQMFLQFGVSSIMVIVCVFVHGAGLFSINHAMRSETTRERLQAVDPLSMRGAVFTLSVVIALVALHGIEIWLYAFVYLIVGATGNLEESLYFSTISYSTVGYSDAHVDSAWRILGAFESILGVILLGWSTAFFIRTLSRLDDR